MTAPATNENAQDTGKGSDSTKAASGNYTINRGVKGADGKNVTRKITVQFPEGKSIQEYVAKAGSEDALLRFLQRAERNDAKGVLNLFVKSKDAKNLSDADLDAKLIAMAPTVNVFSDSGPTKAEKLSLADAAIALANDTSLSDADRAAKMLELINRARG